MTTDEPRSSSPFARGGFVTAAIVVGIIAALGIFVLIATLVSPPNPVPTSGPTDSPGPSAGDASVCGLEGFEATSSLEEAPDVEWELVGTVAAPTDPRVGPGIVDNDGFRSCFAHTSEGALFAAVNYVALSSDPRLQPLVWQLLEDGPVKDQARAQSESSTTSPSSSRLQVAGFTVLSYSADRAVIDVAWQVTSPATGLMSVPIEFVWQGGDWRIATTTEGLPYAPAQIENLGGYIPWSGA